MKPQAIVENITLPNGKVVSIETGVLAKQSDGAVVVRLGDTMLLATVVSAVNVADGVDFMPLTIDYREKFASTGKFPGGFLKREARPSDSEVLTMRLVDRALRPLFPDDFHAETQVMIQLMSSDKKEIPDALACLAASAALSVSDIPFNGPVSEVRVSRIDGNFVVNPTFEELKKSDIDMIIAGSKDSIVMVEGEMKEISEEEMVEAIRVAHEAIKVQCQAQLNLAAKVPSSLEKREYCHETHDEELKKRVMEFCVSRCKDIAQMGLANKSERKRLFGEVREEFLETLTEEERKEKSFMLKQYLGAAEKEGVRQVVLEQKIRLDGRKTDEIRPIWSEVDYLPGCHGSALFTRGETQSLTTLTLGGKLNEQLLDGALTSGTESFLLHYNFPPFSTGEAKPVRGVSRREIGHGNLALRALKPMLPSKEENPYTIRLVSEILESNGSSSMATVCAGTMALLDGGVKMIRPVSGIAMGLITDDSGNFAVLSDILGDEDHLGDMDFKVTGTEKGITACQMDIKVKGLSFEVLTKALHQAKAGRAHILAEMMKTISAPREEYKSNAPRIEMFTIPQDTMGAVIGSGGKVIQEIQAETNTTVNLEEIDRKTCSVQIMAENKEDMDEAIRRIKDIAFPRIVEVDDIFKGKVKTITAFGAFVEVVPGTDGLLHISEIDWAKTDKVEDVLKEGEIVEVKVIGKDPKGKLKLSRKVLLPKPQSN